MAGWLIGLAVLGGYVLAGARVARPVFARKRPFTEPLSCTGNYGSHEHSVYCYQPKGTLITTAAGAAGCAVFYGAVWPVALACAAVIACFGSLAARWTKPTQAEREAAIARLERDTGQAGF
jgi:hypothetical protein